MPDLTVSEFARGNQMYELQVPYMDETLWFVPDVHAAAQLVREGVSRGRIWTAEELLDLASIPSLPREDLRRIVRFKTVFGAVIVDVQSDNDRAPGGDHAVV